MTKCDKCKKVLDKDPGKGTHVYFGGYEAAWVIVQYRERNEEDNVYDGTTCHDCKIIILRKAADLLESIKKKNNKTMKLEDIDLFSDRYDLQRDKDMKLCIHMWDIDALATDLIKCEDVNPEEITVGDIMKLTKGRMNPGYATQLILKLRENK